jgi:hypothetical protein
MGSLTIGEVARRGWNATTLRYREREGVLPSPLWLSGRYKA